MDPTSSDAIDLADDVEAVAARDLYAAAPAQLDLRSARVGSATVLIAPRVPVSYFNRVIGLGAHAPATEAQLDEAIDVFRGAGVTDFWLHLTPTARPTELAAWIAARGLKLAARRTWAKFLRGPEPVSPQPPSTLRIREAAAQDAAEVARTATTAFGLPSSLGEWFARLVGRPGWRVLIAEVDGRIAATGSVFVQDHTAWLGVGATLPEYRRRGAQTALLAARIAAAAAAGCTVLATETGESIAGEPNPSLANIRRAGFEQVCSRWNFAAKP